MTAALGRLRPGAARSWGYAFGGKAEDKAPSNSQPGGQKKDSNLSLLSGRVLGPITGPSNYKSIGCVEEWGLISGFVFGSGFRHDFNIFMAHDGRLPVVDFFREPGARESAKATAKAKAKSKAKAKTAA